MADPREVQLQDGDGQLLASALLAADQDAEVVRAALHVEPGPLPPGTRTRLVDTVLDQPEATPGVGISAALPAGDGEIIERLQQRTDVTDVHRAGATTIVDGTVRPPAE